MNFHSSSKGSMPALQQTRFWRVDSSQSIWKGRDVSKRGEVNREEPTKVVVRRTEMNVRSR